MVLIDTHTHIYAKQFDSDRDEMLKRAMANQVEQFFLPNIDSGSIDRMLQLEKAYPENCFAMMGLHPCSVKDDYRKELDIVESWLSKRHFCAVGEIGLDYYWSKEHVVEQKDAFITQLRWAKELELPIVIHARDSLDDILEIVEQEKDDRLKGIFHCFGGSLEQANRIIDLDFLMGIGGVLTFKKAGLDKLAEDLALEHLVLETDAPYLSPAPYRGKRNESGYVRLIAERLAEIKAVSLEEVAEITTKNALDLFVLKGKNAV